MGLKILGFIQSKYTICKHQLLESCPTNIVFFEIFIKSQLNT